MLAFSVPPGYRRRRPSARPKLDPFTGIIYWDHLLGSSTGIIERILPEDEGEARLPQIGPHGSSENVAWSRA